MNDGLLQLHLSNDAADLAPRVRAVAAGTATQREVLQACHLLRRIGIAAFRLTAEPADLHHALFRSVRLHLHWLRGAPAQHRLDSQLTAPLLDAVACLDADGVRETAALARGAHDAESEYEEEALLPHIAAALFLGDADAPIAARLARYREVLQGAPDLRLPLAVALLARDAAAFGAALAAFTGDWQQQVRRARRDGAPADGDVAVETLLPLEALAWMRLAQRRGVALPRRQRAVPARALAAVPLPDDPAFWRTPPVRLS